MAWAFVQSKSFANVASTGSVAATFDSNVTAGNLILALVSWDYSTSSPTISSIADTRGDTYTQIGSTLDDATNTQKQALYYAKNIGGGANTVTVTFSNSNAQARSIVVAEYSGLDTTSPLVASNSRGNFSATTATDNATTSPNTATPTATGQLIAGFFLAPDGHTGAQIAGGTGFTDRGTDTGITGGPPINLEDRSAPSTSAQNATWTLSTSTTNHGQAFIAIFAVAAGAGDATVTAVPADGVGDISTTVVTAGSTVVTGPADGVGDVPAMTVSGSGNVTVTAVIGDGTGDIPNPTVSGSSTVTAAVADGTGDIVANFPVSVDLGAVPADGTGDVPVPTISVPGGATVSAVPADGTGDVPAPTVRGSVNVVVGPVDGIGFVPAPVVSDGSAPTDTTLSVPSLPDIPAVPSLVKVSA